MLDYTPLTEEQIDRMGLIEGRHKFKVISSEPGFSNKGIPQINLELRIPLEDGTSQLIKAYLSTNGQFMMRRFRHFCRSTGTMNLYETKKVTPDACLGLTGEVDLGIEKGGEILGSPGRFYPNKTIILDFVGDKLPSDDAKEEPIFDELDAIPF